MKWNKSYLGALRSINNCAHPGGLCCWQKVIFVDINSFVPSFIKPDGVFVTSYNADLCSMNFPSCFACLLEVYVLSCQRRYMIHFITYNPNRRLISKKFGPKNIVQIVPHWLSREGTLEWWAPVRRGFRPLSQKVITEIILGMGSANERRRYYVTR